MKKEIIFSTTAGTEFSATSRRLVYVVVLCLSRPLTSQASPLWQKALIRLWSYLPRKHAGAPFLSDLGQLPSLAMTGGAIIIVGFNSG